MYIFTATKYCIYVEKNWLKKIVLTIFQLYQSNSFNLNDHGSHSVKNRISRTIFKENKPIFFYLSTNPDQ